MFCMAIQISAQVPRKMFSHRTGIILLVDCPSLGQETSPLALEPVLASTSFFLPCRYLFKSLFSGTSCLGRIPVGPGPHPGTCTGEYGVVSEN